MVDGRSFRDPPQVLANVRGLSLRHAWTTSHVRVGQNPEMSHGRHAKAELLKPLDLPVLRKGVLFSLCSPSKTAGGETPTTG